LSRGKNGRIFCSKSCSALFNSKSKSTSRAARADRDRENTEQLAKLVTHLLQKVTYHQAILYDILKAKTPEERSEVLRLHDWLALRGEL
jgi:exosome complex RNA-binding protein Rrp4